ncbi:hypothetical protein PCYB_005160 [Plasmodium cynomolgi strain B]|uniref:CYIR protein n=1 Tax=Plasmodium cynomolgi (strain B) TaxID=1120755 RepID=K6VK04_PLACD|nr:hypothetical protein PCYB_005160 [Plasmodium cynomolgi strain B]GAB69767.1 hypothetical protein PCYB_005160 [Plasmodium cynomolgi strain B]
MVDFKLKKDDPFLKNVWNKYKLDNDDYGKDGPQLLQLCSSFHNSIDRSLTIKIDICMQFLRNLKELYNSNITSGFLKHCDNINYWLYYAIKDYNIPYKDIESFFDVSNKIIKKTNEKPDCTNLDLYNNLNETENYVMLQMFNNNIDYIHDILTKKNYSEICFCKKFINACVSLYKSIHGAYSSGCSGMKTNKLLTCLAVNSFKDIYEKKRSNEWKEYNLPKLSSTTAIDINIEECALQTKAEELRLDKGDQSDSSILFPVSTTQSDPGEKALSTTLGTIAGVSSVLALLYKVITNFYLNI